MAGSTLRILEIVARGDSLTRILESLCELVEEQAEGVLACVLLAQNGRLVHGGAPSLPKSYVDAIDGGVIGPSAGSCGTAAHRREQVIVFDIATDPLWADYREVALSFSLRACWSTPIFSSKGDVIATFAMYYREPRSPSAHEQKIIEQITDLAGIAIQRKVGEEKLLRSQHHLAEAQKVGHTGSWTFNSVSRKHVYMSEECFRIHGLDPAQGLPSLKQIVVHMHPEDRSAMVTKLNRAVHERRPWEAEYRLVNFADGPRTIRTIAHPILDHSGQDADWIGTVVDITAQKLQQEEMQRLESRLRQAERFEAMGTLAGGIAHDFNNILGAILGFGERALRSVEEGSRLHRDLSNVIVAGERGRTLVDRILSFSRGTDGERGPVHVEKVVREALNLLRANLPAHVKLRGRLRASSAAVLGDAVQVHQLLMNLGTNAAQAMTQAGTLTVSLEAVEVAQERQAKVGNVAAGGWVVLQVADQGTGMTPDTLERIFDPFFTTKGVGVGTGLGLSLVLRIVTQAGGAIDVQSTPGVGSVFTVYLPRAGEAPEDSQHTSPAAPARGSGQRVMVVDDEEPLLELTTHVLRELGYEPVGYGSARAALEAFRSNPGDFDVLITDLRMPGMSGEALIREVRQLSPLLPVILVSGYVGDAGTVSSNSGWADEVLTKPLRPIALATSLARLLAPAAPAPDQQALGHEPRR